MSINYCTIGTNTVDGFCGTQRAKVLARLIAEKYTATPVPNPRPGSGGISFGPGPAILPGTSFRPGWIQPQQPDLRSRTYYPDRQTDLNKDTLPFEQPFITVTAELFGARGSQTLEATTRLDFVIVTDLEINHQDVITVNISEMEIKHA